MLADDAVLDELEARGLLVAEVIDDGTIDLDVSHSVYADVLHDALSAPRLRVLRRQVVHVAARTMPGGPRDAVRLAILRLEAGEPVDPLTLRTAATAVLWNAGHLLAESLSPTAHSQLVPLGSEGGVALRLARAAWEQSGDIASGTELAVTYAWVGDVDKAAEVLATLEATATDDEELARIAKRARHLAVLGPRTPRRGRCRVAQRGTRMPIDRRQRAPSRAGKRARAGIALNIAHPTEALTLSEEVIAEGPDDLATARARPTIAAALAMTGRADEALAFVDTYLPRAFEQLDTSPLIAVQLLTARNGALMRLGPRRREPRARRSVSGGRAGRRIDRRHRRVRELGRSGPPRVRRRAGRTAAPHRIGGAVRRARPAGLAPVGVVHDGAGERVGRRSRGGASGTGRRRDDPAHPALLRLRSPSRTRAPGHRRAADARRDRRDCRGRRLGDHCRHARRGRDRMARVGAHRPRRTQRRSVDGAHPANGQPVRRRLAAIMPTRRPAAMPRR